MNRILQLAAGLALAAQLGACATIVEGTDQQLSVVTPGAPGAECRLSSPGSEYFVRTPGTITVGRSKHDIKAHCTKEGFHDGNAVIPSNFEGMTLGNLIIGGVIGVGVDAASGALNKYPNAVQVLMEPIEPPEPEPTPLAPAAAPEPVAPPRDDGEPVPLMQPVS